MSLPHPAPSQPHKQKARQPAGFLFWQGALSHSPRSRPISELTISTGNTAFGSDRGPTLMAKEIEPFSNVSFWRYDALPLHRGRACGV